MKLLDREAIMIINASQRFERRQAEVKETAITNFLYALAAQEGLPTEELLLGVADGEIFTCIQFKE